MDEEKKIYNEIGKKIKYYRKKAGLTQEELALKANYSPSFISNIESNIYQSFSIATLNHLAIILNIPLSYLIPTKTDLISNIEINCKHCNYHIIFPLEITKLLNQIKALSNSELKLTCPNCQKKIMF